MCILPLPMNIQDPVERVSLIRDHIHKRYETAELIVVNNLMNFLGSFEPRCIADPIYIDFTYVLIVVH